MQRVINEGLLTIAQAETDEPEKQAVLDKIEEQTRKVEMIGGDEDDGCTCNCSCSSSSSSSIESNAEADEDADAGTDADLDPTTPGKILDAAAQAAANDTDDTVGELSSGSLREYRERQTNASKDGDTEGVNGTPASLAEYRRTGAGKQAVEKKKDRRPSLMDLLRAP